MSLVSASSPFLSCPVRAEGAEQSVRGSERSALPLSPPPPSPLPSSLSVASLPPLLPLPPSPPTSPSLPLLFPLSLSPSPFSLSPPCSAPLPRFPEVTVHQLSVPEAPALQEELPRAWEQRCRSRSGEKPATSLTPAFSRAPSLSWEDSVLPRGRPRPVPCSARLAGERPVRPVLLSVVSGSGGWGTGEHREHRGRPHTGCSPSGQSCSGLCPWGSAVVTVL